MKALKPQYIRMYLNSRGWTQNQSTSKYDTFRNEDLDEDVLVPKDRGLRDYLYRVEDLVELISAAEKRTVADIVSGMMLASAADVIEYRYEPLSGEIGVIPVTDMQNILKTHTSITNFAYRDIKDWHPSYSSSRWSGSKITDLVRVGPTAAGSYIIRFVYPAVSGNSAQSSLEEGLVPDNDDLRRVCDKIIHSLETIVDHAEKNEDLISPDKHISYNFIAAVADLEVKGADLEVKRHPLHAADDDASGSVSLTGKIFPNISNIARNMRPAGMNEDRVFVGHLMAITDRRFENESLPGKLTLKYISPDDPRPQSAKLDLSDDDLDLAYDAMRNKRPVRLKGKLVGNSKSRRIEDPCDLKLLE
ncbi:MAG: hypothetical protein LBT41_00355 [Candidatus Methanoplasma sp.]|nr:hypothetical protein [Candidatus Methanoplasma sp.]